MPPWNSDGAGGVTAAGGGLDQQVAHLETRLIHEALERSHGNKSAAARELGLSERAIRYKILKYGLDVGRGGRESP